MTNVLQFPGGSQSGTGFERVKSVYTVREISKQFGLSEHQIRLWTRKGFVRTAPATKAGEFRYDFQALTQFRRVRELRNKGLSMKQIEAELHGQLNLFPDEQGKLIALPARLSPFEEALVMHEQGNPKAADAYRQAIVKDDYVTDSYCNLGILEFEKGDFVQAFDCFTKALRADPRHFESHLNLAHLYFECGDLRLARLHYELATEIEPSFPDLYFNLGLVHAVNGEFEAAVNILKRARELSEPDEGARVEELLARIAKLLCSWRREPH
jgi:tetratricopeptide (TPR) repeat protein